MLKFFQAEPSMNERGRTLRLGSKVTLCVALVQVPIFALAAVLYIREVRQDYLATVAWRSQALARPLQKRAADLSGYPAKMQRTLGLNVDCQDLLESNIAGGLVHVGVIGVDGRVIAHTDAELVGQSEHWHEVEMLLAGSDTLPSLGPNAYNTLIPVSVSPGAPPVAVIDIGFARQVIDLKVRNTITYATTTFVVFLALSFFLISGLLKRFITHPIAALSEAAVRLARGHHATEIAVSGSYEVGLLADSFNHMRCAIQQQISDLNREIHDREEAQRLLSESEQDLRVTLDSIGDAVIATDTEGRVTRMNPVAEHLTGWRAEDVLGKPLEEFFHILNAVTREPVENPVKRVLATGEIVGLANHTVLIPNEGAERQIADSGAPIKDDSGKVIGVVLVFRDVTEEHALQERLRQSEKMDAIGQLAGGVAHDFNNMLAGIMGGAELLQTQLPRNEKSDKYLSMIMGSTERAADLAGKLLAFSRRQSVAAAAIDVHDVINEAVAILENTVDRRVEIMVNLSAEAHTVIGDATQLQSVFLNLGINASHAMPEGGTLSFESKAVDLSQAYCDASPFDLIPGGFLEVEVRDTGSGVAPEDLGRIFEPFFTTREQGQGTGLGLAAVYGTVRQHGGGITVYSELEEGTSFHVYLPLTEESALTLHRQEESPVQGRGVILLVDDEVVMRAAGEALLTEYGYEVLLAENGQIATDLFREQSSAIDLVILDMIMPVMNGRDCFAELQKIRPDIPIILASGFTQNDDLNDLRQKGLAGFIRKPFRGAALSRVVAEAMQKAST
jgi:PAS domain S-box-containing protein